MTEFIPEQALFGGILIGIAWILISFTIGRIETGTSIFMELMKTEDPNNAWRVNFIIGTILAAGLYQWFMQTPINPREAYPLPAVALSGLLMGFGMKIGLGEHKKQHTVSAWTFLKQVILLGMTFIGAALVTFYLLNP